MEKPAAAYPLRYSYYEPKAIGDFVRIIEPGYSNTEHGLLVQLETGQVGKIVFPSTFGENLIMVNLDGQNYWIKANNLTRVEVLDVLANI